MFRPSSRAQLGDRPDSPDQSDPKRRTSRIKTHLPPDRNSQQKLGDVKRSARQQHHRFDMKRLGKEIEKVRFLDVEPAASMGAMSRASVAGSHDTYRTRGIRSSTRERTTALPTPVRGGSMTTRSRLFRMSRLPK